LIAVFHCDVTSRRRNITDSVTVCGFVNKLYNQLNVEVFHTSGWDECNVDG